MAGYCPALTQKWLADETPQAIFFGMHRFATCFGAFLLAVLAVAAPAGAAGSDLIRPWPSGSALNGSGQSVAFPSESPFGLSRGEDGAAPPAATAQGTLFLPPGASRDNPVPAVVLLHGSAGVLPAREMNYGRQFAAMGIAALVVDSFAARRNLGTGFIDRLMNITEAMLIADAYAGLRYLQELGAVDMSKVALAGFSYGGMATTYALYDQVAQRFAPGGLRFAGHVAFYGPCIVRFNNSKTTGAPLLMLYGTGDAIVNPDRCAEVERDLEKGGSRVERIAYEGAYHQWDGGRGGPRKIGRNLAPCQFRVLESGVVLEARTYLPMTNPFSRKVMLGLCSDGEGYMIGADEEVRQKSNADFGRFLAELFGRDARQAAAPR